MFIFFFLKQFRFLFLVFFFFFVPNFLSYFSFNVSFTFICLWTNALLWVFNFCLLPCFLPCDRSILLAFLRRVRSTVIFKRLQSLRFYISRWSCFDLQLISRGLDGKKLEVLTCFWAVQAPGVITVSQNQRRLYVRRWHSHKSQSLMKSYRSN